jgi:hypothetical protein
MAYGLEVYNSSGNTVLSFTSRVPRFVQSGTVTANSTGTTVTVTGLANNDSWDVIAFPVNYTYVGLTITLNSGSFTVKTQITTTINVDYWVIRS